MTFKFIKKTDFKVESASHTAYVVAHQGRALNVSTLSFAESPEYKITLDEKAKTLTVEGGKIAVVVKPYVDALGNNVNGLSVMPKFDLEIDAI